MTFPEQEIFNQLLSVPRLASPSGSRAWVMCEPFCVSNRGPGFPRQKANLAGKQFPPMSDEH